MALGSISEVTVADVERVLSDLKSYYQARNREVAVDVELYQQSYTLSKPDDVRQVLSPATKAICDRAADRIGGGRLQVHMEPRRPGQKEADRVEALEKAGPAMFWLARKRSKYNPFRAMALHGLNRGGIVLKAQIDIKAVSAQPEQEPNETDLAFAKRTKLWRYQQLERFPIVLDVRPIESVFPDPETDGENYVIEHYKRRVGDIKKNYPSWEGWQVQWTKGGTKKTRSKSFRDDETVDFTEVQTCEWRGVIVDGAWVPIGDFQPGPIQNIFGRPTYFIRYSGFGDPAGRPEEKCVSILRAIRDTVRSESVLLTVLNKLSADEAWGATVVDAEDTAGKETLAFGPAAVIETDMTDPARQPRPFRKDTNLGPVVQGLSIMQRASEMGAVPAEAIGQPSPSRSGQPSGVAAAILTGQASMVIDPLKGAIEDLVSDCIPFLYYVCDAILGTPLTLYGPVGKDAFVDIVLDPDTIDGHYGPVNVEIKLQAPEQNFQAWSLGMQALGVLGPDPYVFEKFFGIENAEEFVKEMITRQIAYSPQVLDYLKARLVERLTAKDTNSADALPGQKVPAPAGFTPPPPTPPGGPARMGGGGPTPSTPSDGGLAGPPLGPAARAAMGIPPSGAGGTTPTAPMLR